MEVMISGTGRPPPTVVHFQLSTSYRILYHTTARLTVSQDQCSVGQDVHAVGTKSQSPRVRPRQEPVQ